MLQELFLQSGRDKGCLEEFNESVVHIIEIVGLFQIFYEESLIEEHCKG